MQDNYFEPDLETAPREVLHWIQSRRLVKMVENCYNNVPLYKKRFDEMGLAPGILNPSTISISCPLPTKPT